MARLILELTVENLSNIDLKNAKKVALKIEEMLKKAGINGLITDLIKSVEDEPDEDEEEL
jgi:2-phosphoglycerate kinase